MDSEGRCHTDYQELQVSEKEGMLNEVDTRDSIKEDGITDSQTQHS